MEFRSGQTILTSSVSTQVFRASQNSEVLLRYLHDLFDIPDHNHRSIHGEWLFLDHEISSLKNFQRRLVKPPPSTILTSNIKIFFSKEGRRHRIFIPEPLVLATKTPIYISTCPRLDRLLFDKDKEDLQTFRAQNSPTIHTVCGCGPQTSSLRPTYSLQSFNRMETSSNLQ